VGAIDLRSIATPLAECLCFALGPVDPQVIASLEEGRYDQAPVVDQAGIPIGILPVGAAKGLLSQSSPLRSTDPEILHGCIETNASLNQLLGALEEADAVLLRDTDDADYHGLLTLSDLNRHGFRSVLYGVLAELEAVLARMVEISFTNPWDWLEKLNEDAQVRLLGSWQLAQRRNVDIGPLASCTLTELLRITATFEGLRLAAGFRARAQFDKAFGSLPDLRNRVMHPVRPLILKRADVESLNQTMAAVRQLTGDVREYLKNHGFDSRVGWL